MSGKDIVPPLDLGEPWLVDVVVLDLLVKVVEIKTWTRVQVVSVLHHRPVFMMKAQSLDCASSSSRAAWLRHAAQRIAGVGWWLHAVLDHPVGVLVQMAIDPVVAPLQPHFAVALVTPARHRRLGYLHLGVPIEILRDGDCFDGLLVPVHLAKQVIDPVGSLEPPVAKQLGVVGGDNQRRPTVHGAGQPFDLFLAVEHEVAGVLGCFSWAACVVVDFFLLGSAGDFVILDAKMAADAGFVQVRLEVFEVQVETDVAVKLAVVVIAGVTLDGGPHLFRRLGIAGQDRHTALGAEDWSVDAVLGPRLGIEKAVGVGEEVADTRVAQQLIDAVDVAAFGQPVPCGRLPKWQSNSPRQLNLGVHRLFVVIHQRQKTVRGSAGDDFELAAFKKPAKTVQEIVFVLLNKDVAAAGSGGGTCEPDD